jgi:hypothetical protein
MKLQPLVSWECLIPSMEREEGPGSKGEDYCGELRRCRVSIRCQYLIPFPPLSLAV